MRIYAAVVADVNVLSEVSVMVVDFLIAAVFTIACLFYLLSLSAILFGLTLIFASIGVVLYYRKTRQSLHDFNETRLLENKFLDNFKDILDGYKEIYMQPEKGNFIYENNIKRIAEEARKKNTRTLSGFLNNQIVGQVLFYVLVAGVLLHFGLDKGVARSTTVNFVFTLFYLLGSLQTIMALLPSISRAGVAAGQLDTLYDELRGDVPHATDANPSLPLLFSELVLKDIAYAYRDKNGFGIGPVDLKIGAGEIIFIFGGNGSGKTTLIYTILGLLLPDSGNVSMNGIQINNGNYAGYRSLFAIVLTDFYLFREIVGIRGFDMERWNRYLELFELQDKVTIENNIFSTIQLSTGQKKRLALIVALLEDKKIIVLDEWAADQDPAFREKFYTGILPMLKEDGVTVIAVTHDDKYYHAADRLYKMDYGRLNEIPLVSNKVNTVRQHKTI
jgi:putative ATP-binding cassette transporter